MSNQLYHDIKYVNDPGDYSEMWTKGGADNVQRFLFYLYNLTNPILGALSSSRLGAKKYFL